MTKLFNKLTLTIVFLGITLLTVMADAPPDPGGDPTGGNPVGGGSPIGGSFLIMLSLAIGYSVKRIWEIRKSTKLS
ncbi:MAG: hypothetical protein K9G76_06685 [Bacteroidales bacterium]|nr:hypothetical protein [Bacteroidales bacterium]MCF8404337.1 hypothetical protein [Bacteroidales bacterium]